MTNKPRGIKERLEQLRPPIVKAEGSTESERYLAKIAEKSFLNLWSYSCPFRNQKQADKGDGKELCDLLVVCGKDIIIFSEKTIKWSNADIQTAWCRWARQAVQETANQAKGAERWIKDFPERIFLDRKCTRPFPLDFPPPEDRVFHRVIVARGATKACLHHFGEGSGSMIIKPSILGEAHWSNQKSKVEPFCIGDIDPEGSFVHVFDEVGLDIILKEQDTIRDFTDYLQKREAFIRSGKLLEAHGEENLMAYYAIRINADGDHDFICDNENIPIAIDRHHYKKLIENPRYIAKKLEDEVSYLWDKLIETFTNPMLNGTSITLDGYNEFDLRKSELGVRYMALQRRFIRRAHGEALYGAMQEGKKHNRFFRTMLGEPHSRENDTAFFIQTLKYLDWMDLKGGYEQYRKKRTESATVYARGLLLRLPYVKRVIGISLEPPGQGRGNSQDLLYAEQCEWTEEDREAILEDCKTYDVLQNKIKKRKWDGQEFPEIETISIKQQNIYSSNDGMNRKQRRALIAKARKKKKLK